MVEQGIVDWTEVASDLQTYITLETTDHWNSISCGLYFWNHHNLINDFGISKYKLAKI
jgi:hypothetical protein